jgi:hypothetical protein
MATSLSMRFYLAGYQGLVLSRPVRRLLAKTTLHRAWLQGHMGSFVENGRKTSVCDYAWTRVRKGPQHTVTPLRDLLRCLYQPYTV